MSGNTLEGGMPPKWPLMLIRKFVRKEYLEEIEGDMLEEYYDHLERYHRLKANYLYCRELIKLFRPNLMKNILGDQKLNHMGMLQNYTKVAFRNIKKHKKYAAIKIGGFSIGIAISLLISLFIFDELKTDRHLKDSSVYRVVYRSDRPDHSYRSVSVPPILAPSILSDYPDVKKTGRILVFDGFGDAGGNLFRPEKNETSIWEEKFGYMDPSVLEMLDIQLVYGDRKNALKEPRSLLISASKSKKYFKNENPIGRVVYINELKDRPYVVDGVYEDLDNSHLKNVDFFFTLSGKEFWNGEQKSWCCYNYVTFIEFQEKIAPSSYSDRMKEMHDRYFVAYELEEDPTYAKLIEEYNTLELQHISDVYLHSSGIYGFLGLGDITIVRVFAGVALFILLLACINFINLTTANSAQRAQEIGLRKAIGAGRSEIMQQFLTEAILLSFISVLLGGLIAGISTPAFRNIVNKEVFFPLDDPLFFLTLFIFSIVIGLLSGLYPSVYLSKIKTMTVLRGHTSSKRSKNYLRSGLVIFQFTISTILITGALIVFKQMKHILDRDLGYDKEQILLIHGTHTMSERRTTFKEKLVSLAAVSGVSYSNSMPVEGTHRNGNGFWKKGTSDSELAVSGQFWRADEDYFDVLDIEIVLGRVFDIQSASDSNAVVINEAMAEKLKLDDPLNSVIENWREWSVVGVVENFHYDDLKEDIRPLLIAPREHADLAAVKISSNDVKGTLTSIEEIWNEFNPNQRLRTEFLDQRFASMYSQVERTKSIFLAFAIFGVIVACLGLFGLSVYTVAQRTKEITVRKVLGASVATILNLLTREYLKLTLIATLIGAPCVWFFAQEWLNYFPYQVERYWDAFVWSAVCLIAIAFVVVSFQSLKSALMNPAKGLRDE